MPPGVNSTAEKAKIIGNLVDSAVARFLLQFSAHASNLVIGKNRSVEAHVL